MISGIELSKFLRIFLPTLTFLRDTVRYVKTKSLRATDTFHFPHILSTSVIYFILLDAKSLPEKGHFIRSNAHCI